MNNFEQAILDQLKGLRADVGQLRGDLASHSRLHLQDVEDEAIRRVAIERRLTRVETNLKVRTAAGGAGIAASVLAPVLTHLLGIKLPGIGGTP